jgi:hypothetical protein
LDYFFTNYFIFKMSHEIQVWGCMPVMPALGKLRQEDPEFGVNLGYVTRLNLKREREKP